MKNGRTEEKLVAFFLRFGEIFFVNYGGSIVESGFFVDSVAVAVRPALWIDL